MFELSLEKYPAVIPLMEGLKCDLVFTLSVIENKQKGSVFVDNIDKPGCAIVINYCAGDALVMGRSDNDSFNEYIFNLINRKNIIRPERLDIIIPDANWEKVFCPLDSSRWTSVNRRVKFRFNKEKFDHYISSKPELPEDYKILRITKDLYDKIDGPVAPGNYWENADKFIENGVGFVMMKNDSAVSTAFSAYICNSMIDIGIETMEPFRGQGFGSYVAEEMINYCLKYRYEPIWGTRGDNLSSIRLAEKLGFERVAEFPMVSVKII